MQTTAKIPLTTEMVVFLNCSKPSLHSPLLRAVELLKPVLERSATILRLVGF